MTDKTGKGKYGDRHYVQCYPLRGDLLTEIYRANLTAIYGDIDLKGRDIRDGEYVALRVKDDGSLPGRKYMQGESEETWAVICTEGVGWVADDFNTIEIPVQDSWGRTSRFFVYVERIQDLVESEPIDLADHVRTFGDRLEGNFDLWASHAVSQESVPA